MTRKDNNNNDTGNGGLDDGAPDRSRLVVALISLGHFFSHFFILALPPLFPLLKQEFNVSYTALGGITALYAACSASAQYPLGTLVDRFGARVFLIPGLAIIACCFIAMGFTSSITALYVLAAVAGLADGVFHPGDYTILSARVPQERTGRAFSVHAFGGFAGFGLAPVIMVPLATLFGWHWAVMIAGVGGLAAAFALFLARNQLVIDTGGRAKTKQTAQAGAKVSNFGVLTSPALLLMFGFYVFSSTANMGVTNHGVSIMMESTGLSFAALSPLLPAYLWGIVLGVVAGGYVADMVRRVDLTATLGTAAAAILLFAVGAITLPQLVIIAVFFTIGFSYGLIMPSRDIVVRDVAPKSAVGRAFGFVNVGYGIGGALGPVLAGFILDLGYANEAFAILAGLLMISMFFTIAAIKRPRHAAVPEAGE